VSSSDTPQFEPPSGVDTGLPADANDTVTLPVEALAEGLSPSPVSPPPRDPVWSGWDVLLIALLTIVTLILAEFVTVLVAWGTFYRHSNFRDLVQRPVLDLLGEVLGYIAVATYMIMLLEGKYHAPFWKAIRWNWNGKAAPKLLGLGVLTVGLDLLSRYLPMPKTTPFEQFFSHPADAYLVAVFAVSLGPLMEELFFRGFLYPVLARRTGVFAAVLFTALPFGLMHYLQYRSWGAVLVITLVGIVLTVVRVLTESVAASFLVHVGYNATLMVLAAVATDGFRHMDKAVLLPSFR
jgi:membrane protease YdiL (CAAX protease family)